MSRFICRKFRKNILNVFQFTKRTQFFLNVFQFTNDRLTDIRVKSWDLGVGG